MDNTLDIHFTRKIYNIRGRRVAICDDHPDVPPFERSHSHAYHHHMPERAQKEIKNPGVDMVPHLRDRCTEETFVEQKSYTYRGIKSKHPRKKERKYNYTKNLKLEKDCQTEELAEEKGIEGLRAELISKEILDQAEDEGIQSMEFQFDHIHSDLPKLIEGERSDAQKKLETREVKPEKEVQTDATLEPQPEVKLDKEVQTDATLEPQPEVCYSRREVLSNDIPKVNIWRKKYLASWKMNFVLKKNTMKELKNLTTSLNNLTQQVDTLTREVNRLRMKEITWNFCKEKRDREINRSKCRIEQMVRSMQQLERQLSQAQSAISNKKAEIQDLKHQINTLASKPPPSEKIEAAPWKRAQCEDIVKVDFKTSFPYDTLQIILILARECMRAYQFQVGHPIDTISCKKPIKPLRYPQLSLNIHELLSQPRKKVVIDSANVNVMKSGRPGVVRDWSLVARCVHQLNALGFASVLVIWPKQLREDVSLNHIFTESFKKTHNCEIEVINIEREADDDGAVLSYALSNHAVILSNDNFEDYWRHPSNPRGLLYYLTRWQLKYFHNENDTVFRAYDNKILTDFTTYLQQDSESIKSTINRWLIDDIQVSFDFEHWDQYTRIGKLPFRHVTKQNAPSGSEFLFHYEQNLLDYRQLYHDKLRLD